MTAFTQTNLEKLARKLPQPKSLFTGVESILSKLPENVLQFHRHDDRDLLSDKPYHHHRFVLIVCLREPGCIILDGEIFKLEPGHGILVFPFQSHHYTRFENPRKISWLFTTFEYSNEDDLESLRDTPFTLEEQDIERLARVTNAYLLYLKKKKNTGKEMPAELAILLSGLIQRQHRYIKRAGGKLIPDVPDMHFLQPLSIFIHKNLSRHIDIKELADCAHLSPSRLRARFRQALGISLGEFIRRTRIHRACGLLHSSDLNTSQVAEACGFNSVFSFSRTFRNITGKAPTRFRKEIRR